VAGRHFAAGRFDDGTPAERQFAWDDRDVGFWRILLQKSVEAGHEP
jgi:hypothetical protein